MDDLKRILDKINEITEAPAAGAEAQKPVLAESLDQEFQKYLAEADVPTSDYERIRGEVGSKKSGLSSFGRAFKQARASGETEFTWKGRKYSTALKDEPVSHGSVDFPSASRKETDWEQQRARMIQRAEAPAPVGVPEIDIERTGLEEGVDGVDTVSLDVPLLMRIMEYAREDAKTDMDLHHAAEQMIALNKTQDHLTMDDYDAIIAKTQQSTPSQEDEVNESDISGLLAASSLNHAYIFTVETAEGEKKKFRVKAQSERVAREKFSKHHSQAKILDVKQEY